MQRKNSGNGAFRLLSVMLFFASAVISVTAFADAFSGESIQNNDSFTPNSSSYGPWNNSSIALSNQKEFTSSPVDLSVGSGYYSTHPIAVGLGSGSRTVIANADSATSMSHEVSFAQEVSGNSGYSVSSSSSSDHFGSTSRASTQMQIDETVTSGRVSIGVLVGNGGPGRSNNGGVDPMTSAWKNPAIEIEEEYVGTYHISKNFALNNSRSIKGDMNSWINGWINGGINGCEDYYLIRPQNQASLSADDVFNCSANCVRP
ncbi:MAG: hypothetical protein LUQ59_01815 [Methanothrix sp.]|nr:hypothetical protein [Methanothrix sp.]